MLETSYVFRDLIPSFDNGSPRPRSCFQKQGLVPETEGLGIPLSKVGFPIRKSADQSFFAAPHGLSQRSTSFIASQRQGIHRMPLSHLIALIINAHPARQRTRSSVLTNGSIGRTLIRKTSLLRIVPTACGQAADIALRTRFRRAGEFSSPYNTIAFQCSEIAHRSRPCGHDRLSERSYLFTMSDITPPHETSWPRWRTRKTFLCERAKSRLVEPDGIEPTTSCLQSRRSPN